jgi:hypothetical protein
MATSCVWRVGKKWGAREQWHGALAERSAGLGVHNSSRGQGESFLMHCMTLSPLSPSLFSVSGEAEEEGAEQEG